MHDLEVVIEMCRSRDKRKQVGSSAKKSDLPPDIPIPSKATLIAASLSFVGRQQRLMVRTGST